LPLVGPAAHHLWVVDQQLGEVAGSLGDLAAEERRLDARRREVGRQTATLNDRRSDLLDRRGQLLATLRAERAMAQSAAAHGPATAEPSLDAPSAPVAPTSPRRARPEWTARRVQNLLLALGALLLAAAAAIFAVVEWHAIGAAGQAAVLAGVTAGLFAIGAALRRRALVATAESVLAVTVAVTVLDALAVRRAALPGVEDHVFWAVATALLAAGWAALSRVVAGHAPRLAAVGLAQAPLVVLAVWQAAADLAVAALLVTALAAADLALLTAARRFGQSSAVVWAAATLCLVAAAAALALATVAGFAPDVSSTRWVAAVALAGVAAVLALAARPAPWDLARIALAGAATFAGLLAALVAPVQLLDARELPVAVAVAGAALAAMLVAHQTRGPWNVGVASAAGVAGAMAVVPVFPDVLSGLLAPLEWLGSPWTLAGHPPARHAFPGGFEWPGQWAVPAVVFLSAGTAVLWGHAQRRSRVVRSLGIAGLAAGALLLPLGLDMSYAGAVGIDVAVTVVLLGVTWRLAERDRAASATAYSGALAAGAVTVAWSLATEGATIVVLGVLAVAFAVVAATARTPSPGADAVIATGLLAAEATATSVAWLDGGVRGLPPALLTLVLATALALPAAGPWRTRHPRASLAVELGVLPALAATALGLAATDASGGWVSWALLAVAVAALVDTLRQDRRGGLPASALAVVAVLAGIAPAQGAARTSSAIWELGLGVAVAALAVWLVTGEQRAEFARPLPHVLVIAAAAVLLAGIVVAWPRPWLAVLAVAAGLAVALALAVPVRRRVPLAWRVAGAAAAALLTYGEVRTVARAAGVAEVHTGFPLALTAAAIVLMAVALRHRAVDSAALEVVAVGCALDAAQASAADAGWLSWALVVLAAALVVDTLRAQRRAALPIAAPVFVAACALLPFAQGLDRVEVTTAELALGTATLLAATVLAVGERARAASPPLPHSLALAALGVYAAGAAAAWPRPWLMCVAVAVPAVAVVPLAVPVHPRIPTVWRAAATGTAAALAVVEVAAVSWADGVPQDRAGFFVVLATSAVTLAAGALRGRATERVVLETVAAVAAASGLLMTASDVGWLSWSVVAVAAIAVLDTVTADRRDALPAAAALLVVALAALAPAQGASGQVVVAAQLAVATAALGVAMLFAMTRLRRFSAGLPHLVAVSSGLVYTSAAAFAWPRPWLLCAALAVPAIAAALLAVPLRPSVPAGWQQVGAAVAAALAVAETAALARATGTPVDRAGFLIVATATALALLAGLLRHRPRDRHAVEWIATLSAATGIIAAAGDPGWLSWSLAAAGLGALAVAVRDDRRPAALIGAALLTASAWVQLIVARVTAPEPYAVPIATVLLLLGYLRRRREPATGSVAAYSPGLALLLLPSLYVSFTDPGPARPLVLGLAALGITLLGARYRLRAPLLIGGSVLAVDVARQVSPYVWALPRWVIIGTAGVLLVWVGATYERRRRDSDRLRHELARLT
jgi:hypothetical protein